MRGAACKVGEVEECADALNHLVRNIPDECRKIDLKAYELGKRHKYNYGRTFMSAFESFPVHCLKFLPCGKRRRPGNAGAAAML